MRGRPELLFHVFSARKADLKALWDGSAINRFDPGAIGHIPTNYEQWLGSDEQYEVPYEPRYEPWVICDRLAVPWYDARFRGYGQNKIVHLEHMKQLGFR